MFLDGIKVRGQHCIKVTGVKNKIKIDIKIYCINIFTGFHITKECIQFDNVYVSNL